MSRAAKRLGRDERGQSLVEMTLVVGLLLLLVAGTVDLGRAFHTYIVLTNAAREGARWGSHYPWDGAGHHRAARGRGSRQWGGPGSKQRHRQRRRRHRRRPHRRLGRAPL